MASVPIITITHLDLEKLHAPQEAKITDVKHLASYNWIEKPTPTIAVPGTPRLWSPPCDSKRLKKDSGLFYVAENAARHPESPLEPLFRAIYVADPSFDITSTDIVSDRNNIQKTVTEFIGPHEFRGYGYEFQKVYTKNTLTHGTGHHRIISYRFGNLNIVIRHKTDGYVADTTGPLRTAQSVDDLLTSTLASLSLAPTKDDAFTDHQAGSKLTIKHKGHIVPIDSILKINTRVAHKRIEFRDVAPQLWVSRTPKLVRAYHNKGVFPLPEVEDVTADVKEWEEANQQALKKLAALMTKILEVVKECGGCAVVKYSCDRKRLCISKSDSTRMLPEDLYSKWNEGGGAQPGITKQ